MLHNVQAYLALEQNNTWSAYQEAFLSQWRDVFKMQAAWRERRAGAQEGVTAAASMNIAVLELYQYAMGERLRDTNHRYGGFV